MFRVFEGMVFVALKVLREDVMESEKQDGKRRVLLYLWLPRTTAKATAYTKLGVTAYEGHEKSSLRPSFTLHAESCVLAEAYSVKRISLTCQSTSLTSVSATDMS